MYVLCFSRPGYQVSVYRTNGPLVFSYVWVAEFTSVLIVGQTRSACASVLFAYDVR